MTDGLNMLAVFSEVTGKRFSEKGVQWLVERAVGTATFSCCSCGTRCSTALMREWRLLVLVEMRRPLRTNGVEVGKILEMLECGWRIYTPP